MKLRDVLVALFVTVIVCTASAQTPSSAAQPSAVTSTTYSKNTELFAEWRPLIAGQATRLTAHLTRTGDRFKPYADGKVTLTLTVGSVVAKAAADGLERPGVFRLNVTPTQAGAGRVVIDVAASTGPEHFVIDDVPVHVDVQAALARQPPVETGLVSYAKERSWEEDFATAARDRALPRRRAHRHGAVNRDRARPHNTSRVRATYSGAVRVSRGNDAPHDRGRRRGHQRPLLSRGTSRA